MNLKKLTFKKIFSGLKKPESVKKPNLYSPHRDWMVIILIFFALLVLSIIGHTIIYLMSNDGKIFNESAGQEIFNASIKRETISDVVLEYGNKETNTDNFQSNASLRDPSF